MPCQLVYFGGRLVYLHLSWTGVHRMLNDVLDRVMRRVKRRMLEPRKSSWFSDVSTTTIAVATASVVRVTLDPFLGDAVPYTTFYPAVMLSSLFGSPRAGGMTLAAALTVATTMFGNPLEPSWIGSSMAFLVSGLIILGTSDFVGYVLQELKLSQQRERLANHELQHRVKNTLAIIQAIASQTFRTTKNPDDFRAAFTSRLVALGQTHNILSKNGWENLDLCELVKTSIEPFVDDDDNFLLTGPEVELNPEFAISMGMCIHELCTNATKYGALRPKTRGRIDISWHTSNGEVILTWHEHNKVPITAVSDRQGFGSRLLKIGPGDGAKTDMKIAPEGAIWSCRFKRVPRPNEFLKVA